MKKIKITLSGNPISNNSLYKRGRGHSFYMSDEAKALKESYQWQAKSQWGLQPLKGNLSIKIKLYFGDKRKHDWDNYMKIAGDSLNSILWKDDEQIIQATIQKCYDKNNPRIEVKI